MTIYQRMERVFHVAGLPGFFQAWRKTDEYPELPALYCTYDLSNEQTALCAGDTEIFRRYDLTIRLFSNADPTAAAEALTDALTLEGFALPRSKDDYGESGSSHIYVKELTATYIDYGEYGKE